MPSIKDIIANPPGYAGSRRAWFTYRTGDELELWHYDTLMLRVNRKTKQIRHISTGHGSVSDQGGMNTAFRVLDLPLRFDRDRRGGGPRITQLPRR